MTPTESKVIPTQESHIYLQVADDIRQMIRSGQLQVGDRLPSYVETMNRYNVSRNTIDRVHAVLEQEGLLDRQHRRGVYVAAAQAKTTEQRTGLIGFMLGVSPDDYAIEPYWSHLLRGVSQVVRDEAGHLVIMHPDSPAATWQGLSGVIFSGGSEVEAMAARHGVPAVTLISGTPALPSVIADDYAGIQAAVQHLLFLGHRRIAFVAGSSSLEYTGYTIESRRVAAYRNTLREAGITPEDNWRIPIIYRYEDGSEMPGTDAAGRYTMTRMLENGFREAGFTAILAQNDEIAIALVNVLQEAGIRVPEDVSVVGFDGTEVSTYFKPQLTTVQLPLREIGRQGAELLLRQIAHGCAADEQIVVPVQFKVRASTAPAAPR